jgi:beta-glucanase (GH16 family)
MIKKIFLNIIFLSISFTATVSFYIDMSDSEFPNSNYDSVMINGSWCSSGSGWDGWCLTLSDDNNDNIYEGNVDLNDGDYEYVIVVSGPADNGSGWGQIINAPSLSSCDFNSSDSYYNYGFTIQNNDIEQRYCAGVCDAVCDENSSDDGGVDGGDDGGDTETWQLVWSDEFNGPDIDESKWNFEIGTGNWGWGNGESQYYTNRQENAFIQDGKLIIKALNEDYNGADYTSARMTTKNKGDWTYGKIEVRAKLPIGQGTWPAIWMMPTNSVYGGWPNSGEIDIMEHVGCDAGNVHGTIHCNEYNWANNTQQGGTLNNVLASTGTDVDEFHIYSIEWNENSINWYVDNINYFTYNKTEDNFTSWPFNENFFLILNLAIGGNWGGICSFNSTTFPQIFKIDYVRVYQ